MAAISIVRWGRDNHTWKVTIDNYKIITTVTASPDEVTSWISDIESINGCRLSSLVVGLDVEWRPNFTSQSKNPVAILQLCVGQTCLIYQLIHTPQVPQSLVNFLDNCNYTFVGVGIAADVGKLLESYNIGVRNTVDLAVLGARNGSRRNAGLKELARNVLGLEVNKAKRVTMSRWDRESLNSRQIKYAALDAFLSAEIGKRLRASVNEN